MPEAQTYRQVTKKDRAELLLQLNSYEVCTIFKSFKTIGFFDSKPGSSYCLLHAMLTKPISYKSVERHHMDKAQRGKVQIVHLEPKWRY